MNSGHAIASAVNKRTDEQSEFPIVCETCLGDNPYVRMQRRAEGTACKICERPMTLFRWKAGSKGRYKSTIVCQQCARAKNCCQTCLFDLDFALPLQVRDRFLAEAERVALPQSRVGKDYQIQNLEQQQAREDRLVAMQEGGLAAGVGAAPMRALPQYEALKNHPVLQKLARNNPYYRRNEAKICSFFVKGTCNRGETCPFKHEMPKHDKESAIAKQTIRDRYHGNNDPVAMRMLAEQEAKEKEEEAAE